MLSLKSSIFVALAAAVAAAADVEAPRLDGQPLGTAPAYTTGGGGRPHHGNQTVVTTTKVVMQYTTYCPEPTTLSFNGHAYTVTAATTLTITDCPCTVVEPCHTCLPNSPRPTHPAASPPPGVVSPPSPPPPHKTPEGPVLVSGASATDRLVQVGVAVAGAAVVGFLAAA